MLDLIKAKLSLYVGAAALLIILGLGTTVGFMKLSLDKKDLALEAAHADITILQQNEKTLKLNMETCTAANFQNQNTIDAFVKERQDVQTAIKQLTNEHAKTVAFAASLQDRINELAKDPKNNGTVSPVLADTIRSIQQRRGQK